MLRTCRSGSAFVARATPYLGAVVLILGAVGAVAFALTGRGPSGPVEIVFERGDGVNPAIYGMSADGTGARRLAPYGSEPTWSPGGRRLAFVVQSEPDDMPPPDELWILDPDEGDSWRAFRASSISTPAWSPDGSRVAFVTTRGWGRPRTISLVDLRDGGGRVLTSKLEPVGLDWSPDGRELITNHEGNLLAVDVVSRATRTIRRKTHGSDYDWSPDGEKVAYVAEPDDQYEVTSGPQGPLSIRIGPRSLFVMNADGSGSRRLTNGAFDDGPSWAPDGETIVFTRRRELFGEATEIYSVSVAGGRLRRLTNDEDDDRPDWRPSRRPEPPIRLARAPLPEPSVEVPDVHDLPLAEAARKVEDAGLKPVMELTSGPRPVGTVTVQSPRRGARVPPGTVVFLTSWRRVTVIPG